MVQVSGCSAVACETVVAQLLAGLPVHVLGPATRPTCYCPLQDL